MAPPTGNRTITTTDHDAMRADFTWKRAKPPVSPDVLKKIEQRLGVTLPGDYAATVLQHHGGRPSLNAIDFGGERDREFRSLLALAGGPKDATVLNVSRWIGDRLPAGLVPFADQSAGNYYCFDLRPGRDGAVVYWDHERAAHDSERALSPVAPSFTALLSMLHEPADE